MLESRSDERLCAACEELVAPVPLRDRQILLPGVRLRQVFPLGHVAPDRVQARLDGRQLRAQADQGRHRGVETRRRVRRRRIREYRLDVRPDAASDVVDRASLDPQIGRLTEDLDLRRCAGGVHEKVIDKRPEERRFGERGCVGQQLIARARQGRISYARKRRANLVEHRSMGVIIDHWRLLGRRQYRQFGIGAAYRSGYDQPNVLVSC